MRITLLVAVSLMLAACESEVANRLADCQRDFSATDSQFAKLKVDQAAANQKIAALEEQLKQYERKPDGAKSETPQIAPTPTPSSGRLKVGLSLPATRERWIKDKLTMLSEAKKRNIELLIQITEDDPVRQISQCENLISQGIKVLILAPASSTNAAVIIEKAAKAGVRVISYERLVMNSNYDYYYISHDGVRTGQLQAEFLLKAVPKGNYLILAGPMSDNNAKIFHDSSMSVLQPFIAKGDIKIVADRSMPKWSSPDAQKACEEVLASNPRIDAILAATDSLAGGCAEAIAAKGLTGKIVMTGQDTDLLGARRLVSGAQAMDIFKDTRVQSRKAIEMAIDLANGKEIETGGKTVFNNVKAVPAVQLQPTVITKGNLDELVIKTGYLNREAVYLK